MKILKAIRLHWRLRIRQEYVCNKVCEIRVSSAYLPELISLNKAVRKVATYIPNIYFIILDLFGGATLLKKHCKIYYNEKESRNLEIINSTLLICFDLVASPPTLI